MFLRLLFLAGVLLAGGAALTARLLGAGRRLRAFVLGTALALVTAGGFGLLALQPAADATRFGRVTEAAAIVGAVGAAAALGSLVLPAARGRRDGRCAPRPRRADARRSRARPAPPPRRSSRSPTSRTSAGRGGLDRGLALLVLVRSPQARRRFPPVAAGVGRRCSGAASIPRAIAAFPSLSSVVDTATAGPCSSRRGCSPSCSALALVEPADASRGSGFLGELVAARRDRRHGRRAHRPPPARTQRRAASPRRRRRTPPPRGRPRARAARTTTSRIALAASPRGRNIAAQVTALGPEGQGVDGLDVQIAGASTRPLRAGLLRGDDPAARSAATVVPVRVGGRTLRLHAARALARTRRRCARHSASTACSAALRTRRHPRAPCVLGEERDHDHLPRRGAEPLLLPDRERPRGGRDRQDALGPPPARTLAALRAGPDQAARALLGIRPDAERAPARRRTARPSTTRSCRPGSS